VMSFAEFLELYEGVYSAPPERVRSKILPLLTLDHEAEGLLDDVRFLITTGTEFQKQTREQLRDILSEMAQVRLRNKNS